MQERFRCIQSTFRLALQTSHANWVLASEIFSSTERISGTAREVRKASRSPSQREHSGRCHQRPPQTQRPRGRQDHPTAGRVAKAQHVRPRSKPSDAEPHRQPVSATGSTRPLLPAYTPGFRRTSRMDTPGSCDASSALRGCSA